MRADAEANREELVNTAWRLLAARGNDVSLRQIATEAGVGIATLYRHFPTRDDLLRAMAEEMHKRVLALAVAAHAHWDADPEAAWSGFVRALAGLRLGVIGPQIATMIEDGWPDRADPSRHVRHDNFAAVDGVLERAKGAGLVQPDLPVFHFAVGLGAVTRPPFLALETNLDLHDWMVEVYLNGLRPRPAS